MSSSFPGLLSDESASEFGDSLCNDSDFEDACEGCAGASPPMEFVDTTEEEPFEDARESDAVSVCPDADVLLTMMMVPFVTGSDTGGDFLIFPQKTMPFDEVPEVLMQVCVRACKVC